MGSMQGASEALLEGVEWRASALQWTDTEKDLPFFVTRHAMIQYSKEGDATFRKPQDTLSTD